MPLRACADMRCVINVTSSDVSRCRCLCSVCSLSYVSSSSSSDAEDDNILAVVRSSHEELDDENDDETPLLLLSLTLPTEYANRVDVAESVA